MLGVIFSFISLGVVAQSNLLVNGYFIEGVAPNITGWTTATNVTKVAKGLVVGSNECVLINGGNGNLRQTVSGVGSDFTLEFSFACPAPTGTVRAFQMRINEPQFTMIVSSTGALQIYDKTLGNVWTTVGTGTPIAFSTVGSNGTLLDADAVIKAYRVRMVFRNFGIGGTNYDIYLSGPNSSALNLFASGVTYYQNTLTAFSEVAFIAQTASTKSYLLDDCKLINPGQVGFAQSANKTVVSEKNQTSDTIYVALSTPPTSDVTVNIAEKSTTYLTLNTTQLLFTPANYDVPQLLIVTAKDDAVDQKGRYYCSLGFTTQSTDPIYNAKTIADISVTVNDDESVYVYPSYSGIYPHLATTNSDNECGVGAIVPWQNDLWYVTYSAHYPNGSDDKLYQLNADMTVVARPESVGGTPANRMIHRESNQLVIGSHFVAADKTVRTIPFSAMKGRMTANARHLTDPTNRIYFATMEEGIYDVDVNTLAVTTMHADYNTSGVVDLLKGVHGKGAYVGQNRLMYSNNGNGGTLAEWKGSTDGDPALPASWTEVDRNKYTEITSKGGIYGAESQTDPVWSLGWDTKSVLLRVCDNGGVWKRYRLPKASYTHDADHGWNTEWPRIRDIGYGDGNYLMQMHGMFFKFPSNFSSTNTAGIKPFASFLKMIVDYADWNGKLVFACNDATKFSNGLCPRDQSNLIFTTREALDDFAGKPYGFGGVWVNETVTAGAPSEAMLVNGFENRILHMSQNTGSVVNYTLQVDVAGDNTWTDLTTVTIPATGYANYIIPKTLNAQWLRVVSDTKVTSASAYFYMENAACVPVADMLKSIPTVQQKSDINLGVVRPMAESNMKLEFAAEMYDPSGTKSTGYYQLDGDMNFVPATNTSNETALRTTYAPTKDFTVDNASVLMTATINSQQYRLPLGDADFSNPTVSGAYPRGIREVVTERSLMNIHGTVYELPRDDSGGFPRIRPITTHNKQIYDFCSWRGMLVMSGNFNTTDDDSHIKKSTDGKVSLWLGNVDDLFKMGTPKGIGSTWKDAVVTANTPSLPYLMQGYANKSVVLKHNASQAVTFSLDVDYAADGTYSTAFKVTVQPGETKVFTFPEGFNAQWVRTKVDVSCTATATFYYNVDVPTSTKVQNPSVSNILVFPNPVNDILTIQGLTAPTKVEVYSLQGAKVLSGVVTNKLSMSTLRSGMYLVNIANNKPICVVKK